MKALSISIIILSLVISTLATTIYVPSQYSTIQSGINAAQNGNTVLVAEGTYHESIDFLSKNIVVLSELGPESTMIDPNANVPTVTISNIADSGAIIEGFTITNSFINNPADVHGIYCYLASPTIRNNIICDIGGDWSYNGGGICAVQSSHVRVQ